MTYENPAETISQSREIAPKIKQIAVKHWDDVLNEALRIIPENDDFPHELIRLLAEPRGGRPKKTWLIVEDGVPTAIAPLRQVTTLSWEPVTQYILPGIVIPARSGKHVAALRALGLNTRVAFWRTDMALPGGPDVHALERTVTYGMNCADDFEAYWKSTDIWRVLRSARNKCHHLTIRENAPGASEWVISRWAEKWGVPADQAQDRILAAKFLEARGRHFSLTLFDGDRPVAGQTCLSHRGEMVAQCIHREDDNGQINNRLIHETFLWAREKGFRAIDIGGGHDYKRKFAPVAGERQEVTICPPWRHATGQALRGLKGRLRDLLRRPQEKERA